MLLVDLPWPTAPTVCVNDECKWCWSYVVFSWTFLVHYWDKISIICHIVWAWASCISVCLDTCIIIAMVELSLYKHAMWAVVHYSQVSIRQYWVYFYKFSTKHRPQGTSCFNTFFIFASWQNERTIVFFYSSASYDSVMYYCWLVRCFSPDTLSHGVGVTGLVVQCLRNSIMTVVLPERSREYYCTWPSFVSPSDLAVLNDLGFFLCNCRFSYSEWWFCMFL